MGKRDSNLRSVLALSLCIVLIMLAVSGYAWTQIPAGEEVCIHWNAAGICDGYGSKLVGFFLMPAVVVLVVGLFVVIPRIEPRAKHLVESRQAYIVVWVAMLVFFFGFHVILTLNVLGYPIRIERWVPALVGLMFCAIGVSLGRVRSNYFFGIRTPWTLSSEMSWVKTHKLGGKLMVLEGVTLALAPLIKPGDAWVYWMIGSLLVLVLFLTIYSYIIWRTDADRRVNQPKQ